MRRRLADISYTVSECYLQENWAQDASWINIMFAFRRNLQQVPANKKLNVGGSGWLSFLYVQWICMKKQKIDLKCTLQFLMCMFLNGGDLL